MRAKTACLLGGQRGYFPSRTECSVLKAGLFSLDRDGVLNELVFYKDQGRIGSPLSAKRTPGDAPGWWDGKKLQQLGAKVVVISELSGGREETIQLQGTSPDESENQR